MPPAVNNAAESHVKIQSDRTTHNTHLTTSRIRKTLQWGILPPSESFDRRCLVSDPNGLRLFHSLPTYPQRQALPVIRAVQGDCQWPLYQCKFLPVKSAHSALRLRQSQTIFRPTNSAHSALRLRQSQTIFRPTNYKRVMPAWPRQLDFMFYTPLTVLLPPG